MSKLLVEKRNVLNEIRRNDMTLQELRFFNFYLAKINARDLSTRKVKFKLKDFQKIMEIKELKIDRLKKMAKRLVQKMVEIPSEKDPDSFLTVNLFSKFELYKDENSKQYYVEIDANEYALPLMFNFKERYFKYGIGNIVFLNKTQIHMFEILKQYENIGSRTVTLEDLKELLNIEADKYERWIDFKKYVIDACQKALEEHTDIKFEYKKIKASQRVTGVEFIIEKNEDYEDPLGLEEYETKLVKPAKQPKHTTIKKPQNNYGLDPRASFTLEDLQAKAGGY